MFKSLVVLAAAAVAAVSATEEASKFFKVRAPPAPYHPPRCVSPLQQKAIFSRFVDGFLVSGKPVQALIDHLADDYIQHNPDFLSGKKVVVDAFSSFPDLGAIGLTYPANIITQAFDIETSIGMVHYYFTPANGTQPTVVVDIFRMNGSAIQEHWDVIQQRPENPVNPLAMFTPKK